MAFKKLFQHARHIYRNIAYKPASNHTRQIHISCTRNEDKKNQQAKELIHKPSFDEIKTKNRNTYLEMVNIFINRDSIYRRGHVEFIYSALRSMEQFGVHKDLQVYKALIEVLPKGKFIPTNMFQAEFMHYPKQQQCAIDLLEQMEENGVIPDFEMEDQLLNIFGKRGYPLRKFWRMMYWMPKFKNLSPWPLPNPLPHDVFDIARLAIKQISTADAQAIITDYHTADVKDAIDETWIISSQSKAQKLLLSEHDVKEPVYVEGAFKVWIRDVPINYFILRANPKPTIDDFVDPDDVSRIEVSLFNTRPPQNPLRVIPTVHEQEDGVILALCATGTSSKDSLLSWIRHLENDGNPSLATIPVVFTLRSGTKEVATVTVENQDTIES